MAVDRSTTSGWWNPIGSCGGIAGVSTRGRCAGVIYVEARPADRTPVAFHLRPPLHVDDSLGSVGADASAGEFGGCAFRLVSSSRCDGKG